MVHWLRLCTPNAEGQGSIPGQRTRFHMWLHAETKSSHAACCNEDVAWPNEEIFFLKKHCFFKGVISI